MLLKNIAAVVLCLALGTSSAWANPVKQEAAPAKPNSSTKMLEATRQRLAQKIKQQNAYKTTASEQQNAYKANASKYQTTYKTNVGKQNSSLANKQEGLRRQRANTALKAKQPLVISGSLKNPTAAKTKQTAPQPKSNLTYRKVYLDGSPYVEDKNTAKYKKKKAKAETKPYEERAFFMDTMLPRDYKNISIFGEPDVTKGQALAYLLNTNTDIKLACSPEQLIDYYWEEASREDVRPDITFCQALLETGFFRYGGDVVHKQNNFCGLGTVGGGVRGASFKTPQLGVRAHVQHLLAYARYRKPKTAIIDPRYKVAHDLRLSRGLIDKWSGLNGTWAMGAEYCEKIMYHYVKMQATKPLAVKKLRDSLRKMKKNKNKE